jgi:transposase
MNARKQTYYGAVDYVEGKLLLKDYNAGNSENTVDYLRYLLSKSPHQRLLIFWDGASYHRSQEVQRFLAEVNLGLLEENGKFTVFVLHLIAQNRIQLRIFGCRQKRGCDVSVL